MAKNSPANVVNQKTNFFSTVPLQDLQKVFTVEPVIEATNLGPSLGRETSFDEYGTTVHIEYFGQLTRVDVTLAEGFHARGYARLNEDDVYNKPFGKQLATTRAIIRALRKYEKWLAKNGSATI